MNIPEMDVFTVIIIVIVVGYFFSQMDKIIHWLSRIHALITYDNKRKYPDGD